MTAIAVVFIALTIVFAGLFVYEYSGQNAAKGSYNALQSTYSSQQSSVVLNDAYAHWDYISIENTTLLKGQYAGNATLDWVGGPLSGTYSGPSGISSTWNRFFGLWSAVWYYTEAPPKVTVNGNNAVVTSENQFVLTPSGNETQTQYLNINYTLDYHGNNGNWTLYREIWDINGAGFISPQQQFVEENYAQSLSFTQWNELALKNSTAVTGQFASNATLYWIGGPLNGTYSGTSQINSTWVNFVDMWSTIWFHSYTQPMVTTQGNLVNVTSMIQFVGPKSTNTTQYRYLNVTFNIIYQNTGLNKVTGMPQFLIHSEVFRVDSVTTMSNP